MDDDDLVVLVITSDHPSATTTTTTTTTTASDNEVESDGEIFLSVMDVQSWDLTHIHRSSLVVKVQADRSRLVQHSSYFRILLQGTFSETSLTQVPVQWNPEITLNVLQFIYGCSVDITLTKFLLLLESSLFFGVDALMSECESWFCKRITSKDEHSLPIPVDSIIEIWSFVSDRWIDSICELCRGYSAQNFVKVTSSKYFRNIPYDLLYSCIEHPCLTVESEKQLCAALLSWLANKENELGGFSDSDKCYFKILKKIRICLLPLGYVAGRRTEFFCDLVDKSVTAIGDLVKDYESLLHLSTNDEIENFQIRVTQYSEKIDLEGCVQLKIPLLFLAAIPPNLELTSKKQTIWSLVNFDRKICEYNKISQNISHVLLCFHAVHYIDMSKCPHVHFGVAVRFLHDSFPSLRVLKLIHCRNFTIGDLSYLIKNFPLLIEVDLTVDITPLIPSKVSILSANIEEYKFHIGSYFFDEKLSFLSNISKLTLEGRTDLNDSDLSNIVTVAKSLSFINLKGCCLLSDLGIATLIERCHKIHSMIVSYTSFGRNSILALCSHYMLSDAFYEVKFDQNISSTCLRLQQLQIDGCDGIDHDSMMELFSQVCMLKSLSLRGTCVSDASLYNFSGVSLESLDISDTMVSLAPLSYIIGRNTGLNSLKMSGCRNLHPHENITSKFVCNSLYDELGGKYLLEEVAFGWGFSPLSFENIQPSIKKVRAITLGIGASLSHQALLSLPIICPLLESVILNFQVISDIILKNILESLGYLHVLCLCCCLGDITSESFKVNMSSIRTLKLEWVTPWMTNDDLETLAQNSPNLVELSLMGCKLLISGAQKVISSRWPGLVSLHLEDCGNVMGNGASSIFECKALEDILLRHTGRGIQRNFVAESASRLPLLRKIALDLCDACDGGFDTPGHDDKFFLNTVTIACCKAQKCGFEFPKSDPSRQPFHKQTIVIEWNCKEMRTTIVKERV